MKRCAVIIGVNNTGGLPVLGAAVSGAKEFDIWARSQEFDTTLITDDAGPVTLAQIKTAVLKYVQEKTYSQMLIFFAGHGILRGPENEHWLLSGAPMDPNEAVNVPSSKFLATCSGIPHIVFISDACRSVAASLQLSMVMGGYIFPNLKPGFKQPDVDMFFATRPGDAAWEVADKEDAANKYKGLFTATMLKGLRGEAPEIVVGIDEAGTRIGYVYSYELKEYLFNELPRVAAAVNITLTQVPFIEVTSHFPEYLSKFPFSLPGKGFPGKKMMLQKVASSRDKMIRFRYGFTGSGSFATDRGIKSVMKEDKMIGKSLEDLKQAKEIDLSGIQTGFTVTGTVDFEFEVDRGNVERIVGDSVTYIRITVAPDITSALIILADGSGSPLAVLPGFIGNILVEDNRIVNVNYVPSEANPKYEKYKQRSKQVDLRRAAAAFSARHGMFRIEENYYAINRTAGYLRNEKALDPTLGLYAAYAYAQAGKFKDVRSVYEYMTYEPEPVLFDVKLLASLFKNDRHGAGNAKEHAPFCPVLSQGWSFLSLQPGLFNNELRKLALHLMPSLWTTFSAEGIAIIRKKFQLNRHKK